MDFSPNKVTPLSKALAIIIFIALPFVGLWLGAKYQKNQSSDILVSENMFQKELEKHSKLIEIKPVNDEINYADLILAGDLNFYWKSNIMFSDSSYAAYILDRNGSIVRSDANNIDGEQVDKEFNWSYFTDSRNLIPGETYIIKVCQFNLSNEICGYSNAFKLKPSTNNCYGGGPERFCL